MKRPSVLRQRATAWLARHPAARAGLWGLLSALALPPLHLLPALLFAVPGFMKLIGGAKSWRHAAFIAWCFGFGLNIAGLYWITEPILTEAAQFWWLVPLAAPLLAFAVAFYSLIPALAIYWLKPGPGRLLVFAGAWVASDLLRQFAFSGFPWNLWGTDWTIPGLWGDLFIQIASLIGVHGMTLLTVLAAGLPIYRKRGLSLLGIGLVLWAAFGWLRLHQRVLDTNIKVAFVQPDFPVPGNQDRATLVANWQALLNMSHVAVVDGANTIIWPEGSTPWLLTNDAAARTQLASVTGTLPVLSGGYRFVTQTDYRNSLIATDGPGPAAAYYDKWKLVPFGEYMPAWIPIRITPDSQGNGFTWGNGPKTLHVPGLPPFGPLICYEAIFTGQIVDEKDRPDWLVNITDDAWFGNSAGPRQHFADARLRAVEEGLPLARDANSGITAMIDGFGHVRATLPLGARGILISTLPGPLPMTLYARFGLIIPGFLAGLIVIAGLITNFFA